VSARTKAAPKACKPQISTLSKRCPDVNAALLNAVLSLLSTILTVPSGAAERPTVNCQSVNCLISCCQTKKSKIVEMTISDTEAKSSLFDI
jgi:hypothetical protein